MDWWCHAGWSGDLSLHLYVCGTEASLRPVRRPIPGCSTLLCLIIFELTNLPQRLHLSVRSASHPIHLACRRRCHGGCGQECGEASAQVAPAGQRRVLSSSSNPAPEPNTRARNMAGTWTETRVGKDLTEIAFSFCLPRFTRRWEAV